MIKTIVGSRVYTIGILVVITGCSVFFGFVPTFQLFREVTGYQKLERSRGELERELHDFSLNENSVFVTSWELSYFQAAVLEDLQLFLDGCSSKLFEVKPVHTYKRPPYEIHTLELSVEGGFHDLLKLQKRYESPNNNFRLVSVDYQLHTSFYKEKERLVATYFVQNIFSDESF